MKAVNTQWTLTYDDTKLEYDPAYNMVDGMQTICPSAASDLMFNEIEGGLKGTFSKLNLITFDEGADLVSVTFKVIGTGVADVYLNVEYFTLAYTDLDGAVHNASIIDYGEIKDISAVPGFENAAISLATEINGSRIMGDVDGDGEVTIADATMIMKYIVSVETLNASQERVADVDGDGIVTIKDATNIQKYIVGMIDEF